MFLSSLSDFAVCYCAPDVDYIYFLSFLVGTGSALVGWRVQPTKSSRKGIIIFYNIF